MGILDAVKVEYIDCFDKAMEFKRWLGTVDGVLGVDVETTGLNPYEPGAAIRLIQFGDPNQGWAMSWELWKGLALEALTSWSGDYVGHNFLGFDVKWIEHHSTFRFPRHRLHDTMLQAHIIDPLGFGGLKPLSKKYIDEKAAELQRRLDAAMARNGWDWATVPIDFPMYHYYGALDPLITTRLHEIFMRKLAPGSAYREVYSLELAVRHVVTRMEQRGIRLDTEYAQAKSVKLLEYADYLRTWGKEHYGINLGSGPQLAQTFADMGAEFTVYSKLTEQPSVDKHQLKIFANGDDPAVAQLAQTVLNLRRAAKYGGDYFDKFVRTSNFESDGYIIHPTIKTLGARTSRMSVGTPPMQQIPKQEALVRNAFIPREGNVLVTCDFSQIEMRLMSHFSQDSDLQQAFKTADAENGDFFVQMGREIYNEPDFQKSDKRRSLVKSTLYGLAYGAGAAKMAETAGVDVDYMREVMDSVLARYPGIKRFMRKVEHEGVSREKQTGQGYVVTPFGRKLPCDPGKAYTLVNYMLQGHAAEYFKKSLVELDAAGYGNVMLLPVHDEIILDLPATDAPEALERVPRIMQNTNDYAVPLLADADGPYSRWGEKYAG